MKPIHYILATILTIVWLLAAMAFVRQSTNTSEKHLEVVLRDIGHRLLLKAGDSTSRILPIEKIQTNTYQISFQQPLRFMPDTLINLVHRQLQKNDLPQEYIVNVLDCLHQKTVFAYEISAQTNNVIPCTGREQEEGCYRIQVEFLTKQTSYFSLLLVIFIPLCFVGFYAKTKFNQPKSTPKSDDNQPFVAVGQFRFYPEKRQLSFENEAIELSEKETQLLQIFVNNQNQIVERERLMKEIWEDEGVVVISRNIDVWVSKLRKKLSQDESLKIINIHGKGYKLTAE